jgi:hypothetical protein
MNHIWYINWLQILYNYHSSKDRENIRWDLGNYWIPYSTLLNKIKNFKVSENRCMKYTGLIRNLEYIKNMLDDNEYNLLNLQSTHQDMRQHKNSNQSINLVKYSQDTQIQSYNFHNFHHNYYKPLHFHRILEDITQHTHSIILKNYKKKKV